MGGQYVMAASKVTIVGWLLCEAVNWSTLGGSYRWIYDDDCYALLLTLSFFRSCWSGWALPCGVEFMNMGVCFALAWCGSISVGRVLFPWVLEIMLSGPRLLLSALALGMSVLGLVVDPPVLLLCFTLFVYVSGVSLFPLFYPLVLVLLLPEA